MTDTIDYGYLLDLDHRSLAVFTDGDAMNQRIMEWFAHPIGSIADNPAWGHPFSSLQFEPTNPSLEAMIEMSIVGKLPRDVKGLVIRAVRVVYQSIDDVYIYMEHNGGNLNSNLSLKVSGS